MAGKSVQDYGPTSHVQEPVMRDVARVSYDLQHSSHKCGVIGSLQTLSVTEVVAGDTFELDAAFVFRLSPLRQFMFLDAIVDLFVFYEPYRHVYGSNWVSFMRAGYDEGVTLGTATLAAQTENNYNCFGYYFSQGDTVPRYLPYSYINIYNRYFRDPTDVNVNGATSLTYFAGTPTANEANYGLSCCHLKRIWNCANLTSLTSADYSLPLSGGEVNLYELAALKGRLQTETTRDWFATRYQDLLKHTFDTKVNIDADERPELIMRTRAFLSGNDINGTDDATLGSFVSKSSGIMRISHPPKLFPEHGTYWIMALVRFPSIIYNEWSYLTSKNEPTYAQIAGDPAVIRRSKPVSLNLNEICESGPNVVVGDIPHSQWYREHPNLLHEKFQLLQGHPFISINSATTRNEAIYISPTLYDDCFRSRALAHWNSQGHVMLSARRFVPDPRESIFAGTE